ncbi:MAG: hypothetical protein ABIE84_04410 [bacterium]
MKSRLFAASAYLFGIPALYIVLTQNKGAGFVRYHAEQALYLWLTYLTIFFLIRLFIGLLWSAQYIPGLQFLELAAVLFMAAYLLYRAYKSFGT